MDFSKPGPSTSTGHFDQYLLPSQDVSTIFDTYQSDPNRPNPTASVVLPLRQHSPENLIQMMLLIGLGLGKEIFPYMGLGLEVDPDLEAGLGLEVGGA